VTVSMDAELPGLVTHSHTLGISVVGRRCVKLLGDDGKIPCGQFSIP